MALNPFVSRTAGAQPRIHQFEADVVLVTVCRGQTLKASTSKTNPRRRNRFALVHRNRRPIYYQCSECPMHRLCRLPTDFFAHKGRRYGRGSGIYALGTHTRRFRGVVYTHLEVTEQDSMKDRVNYKSRLIPVPCQFPG